MRITEWGGWENGNTNAVIVVQNEMYVFSLYFVVEFITVESGVIVRWVAER